jgi:hypothetical protein
MKNVAHQIGFRSLYAYPSGLALFFFSLTTSLAQDHFHQPVGSRFSGAHTSFLPGSPATDSLSPGQVPDGVVQSGYHLAKKGYWRLRTQYATRRTLIEIFDSRKRLVYQEQLLGKYLKLNRKNTQLLNQLCDRLLDKQLVASSIKASQLPEEINPGLLKGSSPDNDLTSSAVLPLNTVAFQANTLLTKAGKLQAIFINPLKRQVSLQLWNANQELVYEEISFLSIYNRTFDLAGLPEGIYTLKIQRNQERYVRKLRVRYSGNPLIPEWVAQPKQQSPSVEQL